MPMRGNLVLTFVAGLVVGVVVTVAGWHPQALGQRAEQPRHWEYKVVTFTGIDDASTKQLNQLDDEGWEYIGLVSNQGSHVAFRRAKK
jgi:hypothetical protein